MFNSSPNGRSFLLGFMRGLSSPAMFFAPTKKHEIPKIELVKPALMYKGDPLTEDWRSVGIDLWASMEKYGKKTNTKD